MKPFRLLPGFLIALMCLTWSAPASAAAHVYLLRGIFNVSVGLDALAAEFAQIGIAASVFGNDDTGQVAALAAQAYRDGSAQPIILVGHSFGAGAAVDVARQLNAAGIPVALLITLDPVGTHPVPRNVARAINLYVSGGQGVPVQADADFGGNLSNTDLRSEGLDHMTIQSAEFMHRRLIAYVREAVGGGVGAVWHHLGRAARRHGRSG